ncbi:MAG: hypothetical protein ACR2HO_07850 [Rubrobacteraceae bacterium]|nr:hypothetical protein [Rubrobacter sp.]
MDNKGPTSGKATGSTVGRDKSRLAKFGSLVGISGTLVCSLSMVAVAVGLFVAGGTAATQGMAGMGSGHQGGRANVASGHHGGSGRDGMAGMGSKHQGGAPGAGSEHHSEAKHSVAKQAHTPVWLEGLLRFGPVILVVSVLLVTASVTLRRRLAALPAISGGLILYVGMYAQPNLALMYAAIVVGTVLLIIAFVASLRPTTKEVGRQAM